MKNYALYLFLGLVVCVSFIAGGGRVAHADMLITPTMVVFEDRDRFATVTLVNTGKKIKTYEFNWEYFNMQEGLEGPGTYVLNEDPITGFDLSKHLVFAPKRVTLAPGAKQKVRLALRRPAEIADGDYHVHFKFLSVPNGDEVEDGLSNGASMGVNIAVSYAIPIIFRAGEVNVQADIGNISLSRDKVSGLINVAVPVSRTGGDYSVLGHMRIFHVAAGGKEELVGELSNANIFPEINKRVFDVHLTKQISGGSLKIVLRHHDKNNDFIYTERSFPVR